MAYLAKIKKPALLTNVSIVGNPSIKDGKVSGFTANNWARMPYAFTPENNAWEQVWKVTTSADITSRQHFTCLDGNIGNYKGVVVVLQNSAFQFLFSVNGTSWYSQTYGAAIIKPDTVYWVKFYFDGALYKVQISLNGINFEDYLVYNESAPIHPNPSPDYVGVGWNLTHIWTGSIDLNESYIKINNEFFWKGMDYNVPDYIINGILNIEKNGLVSNFSANNYLTLPKVFSPNETWEILFKVNVGSSSDFQTILASIASSINAPTESKGTIGCYGGIHLLINPAYKLTLYLSSINSSWNILNEEKGLSILTVGADYWVKLVFTGTQYILYLSTTGEFNGEETNEITVNSTASLYPRYYMIGLNGTSAKKYWGGSIDLSKSYTKIGDKIWWSKDKTGSKVLSYPTNRKIGDYYKYTYADWSQPTLTSDGTIGGTSYGCSLTSAYHPAYYAFNKNTANYATSTVLPATLIFYSPEVLKISAISITNRDYQPESVKDYSIEVSMDGVNYQQIGSGTNPVGTPSATWNCELNAEAPNIRCKYVRFNLINVQSAVWVSISEISITALYQDGVTKGTPDDYDYYDVVSYSYVARRKIRKYYKHIYNNDWVRPNLTSNGTLGGDSLACNASTIYSSSFPAWKALDGNTATWWLGSNNSLPEYTIYNPVRLNISKIAYNQGYTNGNYSSANVSLLASDDNINYVELGTFEVGTTTNISLPIDTKGKGYLYYKLKANQTHSSAALGVGEFNITAKYATSIEVSESDDWDYYVDVEL